MNFFENVQCLCCRVQKKNGNNCKHFFFLFKNDLLSILAFSVPLNGLQEKRADFVERAVISPDHRTRAHPCNRPVPFSFEAGGREVGGTKGRRRDHDIRRGGLRPTPNHVPGEVGGLDE